MTFSLFELHQTEWFYINMKKLRGNQKWNSKDGRKERKDKKEIKIDKVK